MWLLDKMLAGYVSRGELTVIDHKGRTYRYGRPDPEFAPVTVRLADSKVVRDIARDPGLGAAETAGAATTPSAGDPVRRDSDRCRRARGPCKKRAASAAAKGRKPSFRGTSQATTFSL